MALCKGCGKPIVFAKSRDTKKIIPLDVKSPVFIVSIVGTDKFNNNVYVCDQAGEALMVSHMSVCPQANRFSKTKMEDVG
jgi:hypothetical protein